MKYNIVSIGDDAATTYTNLCKKYSISQDATTVKHGIANASVTGIFESNFEYNSNGIYTPALTNTGVLITYIEGVEFHVYNVFNKDTDTIEFSDITENDTLPSSYYPLYFENEYPNYISVVNGIPEFTKIENSTNTYLGNGAAAIIGKKDDAYKVFTPNDDGTFTLDADYEAYGYCVLYSHYLSIREHTGDRFDHELLDDFELYSCTESTTDVLANQLSYTKYLPDADTASTLIDRVGVFKINDRRYTGKQFIYIKFNSTVNCIVEVQ